MVDAGRALIQDGSDGWLSFERPLEVLETTRFEEVARLIERAEHRVRTRGLHGVGVVAYEAGGAWGLPVKSAPPDLPLAWFGLYESGGVNRVDAPPRGGGYSIVDVQPTLDRAAFEHAFRRVRRHLEDGETYQVNFTFCLQGAFSGSPLDLFADLVEAQQGGCSAYVDLGGVAICSASPELFFEKAGHAITTRPMKGTARRGRTSAEDEERRRMLEQSAKQRAENVMIVDMMRNDLGRIAEIGSVHVPDLFTAERYPNVWQLTSTVRARTDATLAAIFGALHPSASVTGAPKVSTMGILRDLEAGPRGVYTGSVGHLAPDGSARFNVAIRTAVVERREQILRFGIGSGLVWDSNAGDEYDECLLKGSILTQAHRDFDLLETLRWTPEEGFWLLDRHLARVCDSARYFGRPFERDRALHALAAAAGASSALRIRLLVDRFGDVRVEAQPLLQSDEPVRLRLALQPVDRQDVFLCHKTTARGAYERARRPEGDDTLLWNQEGEVTETTIANVLFELDGLVVTPPVTSGLLAGTCRAELLASGEVQERVVRLEDLRRVRAMWVTNAVQGRRPAVLVRD